MAQQRMMAKGDGCTNGSIRRLMLASASMLRTLATKRPFPSRKRVRAVDAGTMLDMARSYRRFGVDVKASRGDTLLLENRRAVATRGTVESLRKGLAVGLVSAVATPPSWAASAALVRRKAGPGRRSCRGGTGFGGPRPAAPTCAKAAGQSDAEGGAPAAGQLGRMRSGSPRNSKCMVSRSWGSRPSQ